MRVLPIGWQKTPSGSFALHELVFLFVYDSVKVSYINKLIWFSCCCMVSSKIFQKGGFTLWCRGFYSKIVF